MVLAGVLALVGVAGVGAAVVVDRATDSPMTSAVPVEPFVLPVERAERREAVGVGVTVAQTQGAEVLGNAVGVVTRVLVEAGGVVGSGSVVMEVQDSPVVAMASSAPLWRDLSLGATGSDVRRLQEFLTGLSLFDGEVDGRFGEDTRRAVVALQEQAGLDGPRGVLRLEQVVWIGEGRDLPVAEVLVQPGQAVSAGSPVFRAPDVPAAVMVSEPSGGLGLSATQVELVVGERSASYEPGSGQVQDPAFVQAVAQALGPGGEGIGQVRAAATEEVLVIPSSAVVVDTSGATCVFPDATAAPVPVEPVGGGLAATELPADTPLSTVLANPREVRGDDASCS